MMVSQHFGQHDDCFACKLRSISFDRGRPKTHVKKGDPWKDNPVAERINELKREGAKYEQQGKQLKMAVIEKGPHAAV